jgi:hypothetical protein
MWNLYIDDKYTIHITDFYVHWTKGSISFGSCYDGSLTYNGSSQKLNDALSVSDYHPNINSGSGSSSYFDTIKSTIKLSHNGKTQEYSYDSSKDNWNDIIDNLVGTDAGTYTVQVVSAGYYRGYKFTDNTSQTWIIDIKKVQWILK